MALTNKWTNPFRRSYQDIKNDLIEALQKISGEKGKPLITDISDGNLLVMILSLFAAIAETLHYYIDNMARECFISTARKYSSVVKQGLLVDYIPRGANAATVDVILTRQLDGVNSGAEIPIPKDTKFTDSNGHIWLSAKDVVWGKNSSSVVVPLIQHEPYLESVLNNTKLTDVHDLVLDSDLSGKYIEQGTIDLNLDEENWVEVDTFAYSSPQDRHYRFIATEGEVPSIMFGNGKFGRQPKLGSTIEITFYVTNGKSGNVYENSITKAPAVVTTSIPTATCNNPYPSGDGFNYESIEMLRRNIPIQARTMGVAITKQDFIDCAKLVPGVKDVALEYICGRKLNLYVSPVGGGIASNTLLGNVENRLRQHAPMTTWLSVFSAGISKINLGIEVTGKPSFRLPEIQKSIIQALYDAYSYEKAHIGGRVRISDIYALIDNLQEVDFLQIKKFYVSPWPTIIYGDTQLDIDITALNKAKGRMSYILSFESDSVFSIYSVENRFELEHQSVGQVTVDDTINGFNFSLKIKGSYALGNKYQITLSEPNLDYEEPGYNQVIFDHNLLTLAIHETV